VSSPALSLAAATIHIAEEIALRADRGDVCRVAGPAWTVQRDSSGQANADEAGSLAGRQMVSRPRRQQRPLLGNGAGVGISRLLWCLRNTET
jgi:hypothetical protein